MRIKKGEMKILEPVQILNEGNGFVYAMSGSGLIIGEAYVGTSFDQQKFLASQILPNIKEKRRALQVYESRGVIELTADLAERPLVSGPYYQTFRSSNREQEATIITRFSSSQHSQFPQDPFSVLEDIGLRISQEADSELIKTGVREELEFLLGGIDVYLGKKITRFLSTIKGVQA